MYIHIYYRFYGCLSLPFTFAFFLMFSFAASLHEDIADNIQKHTTTMTHE